jgi:hypothetical protein
LKSEEHLSREDEFFAKEEVRKQRRRRGERRRGERRRGGGRGEHREWKCQPSEEQNEKIETSEKQKCFS